VKLLQNFENDYSAKLLQEVKESGLLDTENALNCINCNAIFPKEYEKCPHCENKVFDT
jgi:uncharacterized paraquat-inducible protein A